MTEEVPLRLRIGGRGAVSWWLFAVLCVLAVAGGLQRWVRIGAPDDALGPVVVVVAAACVAVGLVLALAASTVLRHRERKPVAWWLVAATGAIAGVAQAVVVVGLSAVLDAPTWGSFAALAVRDAVVAGATTIVVAAVLAEADDHRRRREAILEQLVEIRGQDAARAALTEQMRQAMQRDVMDATEGIRARLDDAPLTEAERRDFARGLMNAVDRDLRPLSRRLQQASAPGATGGTTRAPWPHWRELRVQPLATAVALMLLGFLFLFPSTRAGEAAARTVSLALLVSGALALVAMWARRTPNGMRWQMATGLVAAPVAGLANYAIWRFAIQAPVPAGVLAGVVVGVPLCVLLVSGLEWARDGWRGRLSSMRLDVDEAQLDAMAANREFARVSRELAQYVHGTMQSHLLATAFAVENAGHDGDPAAVSGAIESARAVFATTPSTRPSMGLDQALAEQAAVWEGFVDMHIEVSDSARGVGPDAVARIARVVEEAVSNARKHGGARRVDVQVATPSPGVALVTVRDDGHGPRGGDAGLGSALLDEAASGGWDLTASPDGGALLTARVITAG